MKLQKLTVLCIGIIVVASPQLAQGQNLADLVSELFSTTIQLAPPGPGAPSFARNHQTDFEDREAALRTFGLMLNESILAQSATLPVGSSSGGFTYTFDEKLGTLVRSTDSFGPLFAERVQTLGKGKWNVGFNFQQASYESLGGLDLKSGEIQTQLRHIDIDDDPSTEEFFEGDVVEARARVDLTTETSVTFFSYGVTNRFDLGIVVPVVQVDLEATSELRIIRLATDLIPEIHQFPGGADTQTSSLSGSASGIGDVLLRAKYRFSEGQRGGWAAALDLRLPTGDEDDLLGTGAAQGKLFFIGSTTWGNFSPHVNFGYTLSESSDRLSDLPDELNYTVGFDAALHPRVTIFADFVGRTLLDATKVELQNVAFEFNPVVGTDPNTGRAIIGSTQTVQRPTLMANEQDLDLFLGSFGFKFNPKGNFLISTNLLFSFGDDGLQDEDVIPLIGIDYSF